MPRTKQRPDPTTTDDASPGAGSGGEPSSPPGTSTNPAADPEPQEGTGGDNKQTDPVDINLVVIAGRLSADPESRTLESGTTLVRFLVTVRLSQPRRRVDVIPVTMWEPPDDLIADPPLRGDRVWFTGNIRRRFWEGPEGRRSRLEVVAHHFQRGDGPDATGSGGGVDDETGGDGGGPA
ncbi:MAG: single-stranded DNA-binding protein [Acidimicrobiia bacterium]|nr:single-stranded DNA-binding protein [Acidimicrobiia bacterium]